MSFFTHRSAMPASSLALTRQASQMERHLTQEYRAIQALFTAQPAPIQFFIKDQAQALGEALIHGKRQEGFSLPHWIICRVGVDQPAPLPASFGWQHLENWKDRLNHIPLLKILDRRLSELERENHPAVVTAAALLRYATAQHLVRGLLPPVNSIVSIGGQPMSGPWLDEQLQADPGTVLVAGCLTPVRTFVEIFRAAYCLAAYIIVDDDYRQKHYNLLGGWLEQCRALAIYETEALIENLLARAEATDLNRGLRLSLPYFDDQLLEMRLHEFPVIPAGRIPFDPDLLVAAARAERLKVTDNFHLSATTRLHLLAELRMIERAFQDRPHPNKM